MWLNTKWRLKKLITFQVWLLRFSCKREFASLRKHKLQYLLFRKGLEGISEVCAKMTMLLKFSYVLYFISRFSSSSPPSVIRYFIFYSRVAHVILPTSQSRQRILTLAWETDVDTFAHFCCLFYGVILSCCLTSFHTNLLPFSLVPRS